MLSLVPEKLLTSVKRNESIKRKKDQNFERARHRRVNLLIRSQAPCLIGMLILIELKIEIMRAYQLGHTSAIESLFFCTLYTNVVFWKGFHTVMQLSERF